jgi:hypothetical protein
MEKTLDTDQDTERLFRAAPLVVGPLLYVTFLNLQDALDKVVDAREQANQTRGS